MNNFISHLLERRKIGSNYLRATVLIGGGFVSVCIEDADDDDGDIIIVNEDDIEALRDYLNEVLAEPTVAAIMGRKPK